MSTARHVDDALPLLQIVVLLAAGDRDLQRRRHLCRPRQFPVGAGFLEVAEVVLLEQLADLDGLARRVATVAVGQDRHVVADGLAHGRNQRLGATRPLIFIVAGHLADANFERAIAELVAQLGRAALPRPRA